MSGVVGVQTYQEYETWQNEEWGVLEHVFAITTAALPEVPDWKCVDPPVPIAPGRVHVKMYSSLEEAPAGHDWWASEVSQRLPVGLDFQPLQPIDGLQDAYDYARENRDEVVIVLNDRHYRGPVLNDRLEGFACGNIAVINVKIDCPESIVAHEIGHVLGLGHTSSGLMRARGVACHDELVPRQSLWLKEQYVSVDEGFIREITGEPAADNADREPATAEKLL